MKEVLDRVFEFLWKIPEINLWPYMIALIVVMFAISFGVQTHQMKKVVRMFSEGAIDDKTVKLCEKFRRRSIFPQSAELHDRCCCMLCSMHMERGEEERFFANINDIKNVTDEISWRVYLLLAAYLTNRCYLDFSNQYREQKTEGQSAADWLKEQQLTYDEDQLKKATEKITNSKVLEILKVLTEDE